MLNQSYDAYMRQQRTEGVNIPPENIFIGNWPAREIYFPHFKVWYLPEGVEKPSAGLRSREMYHFIDNCPLH